MSRQSPGEPLAAAVARLAAADDLRYVFAYTDFAGNFFLEDGRCETD